MNALSKKKPRARINPHTHNEDNFKNVRHKMHAYLRAQLFMRRDMIELFAAAKLALCLAVGARARARTHWTRNKWLRVKLQRLRTAAGVVCVIFM